MYQIPIQSFICLYYIRYGSVKDGQRSKFSMLIGSPVSSIGVSPVILVASATTEYKI